MGIKWMVRKADFYEIKKSVSNINLESLKKEVIEILKKKESQEFKKAIEYIESQESKYSYLEKSSNGSWIEKAGYGVGTVRIWKGKKYKKVAANPVKWVRVFDKEDRGAKSSMTRLIHKVEACNSVEELYQFCMSNHALFKDENGVDLPIMDKLKAAIDEQSGKLEGDKTEPMAAGLGDSVDKDFGKKKEPDTNPFNMRKMGYSITVSNGIDEYKKQKKILNWDLDKQKKKIEKEYDFSDTTEEKKKAFLKPKFDNLEMKFNAAKGNIEYIKQKLQRLADKDGVNNIMSKMKTAGIYDEVMEEATEKKEEPEKESELKNNFNMSKRAKNKDRFVADVKNQLERQIELMDNDSKIKAMENLINREGKRSYNGIAAQQIIDELKNKTDMKSQINNMISESVNNNLTENEFGDLLIDKFPTMKADVYNRAIKDYKQKLEESESEKHQNRSDAMKGNQNAYKGGPKEEPKDYSHLSTTELEEMDDKYFEAAKNGDDDAMEIHNRIRKQIDLNNRKLPYKRFMKNEDLQGRANYLDESLTYHARHIDQLNKQIAKLEGKNDGKSLIKHNKLVDDLHEIQAEFEAVTQLKNDLYDDWDKLQKEIADNYKGKMKSKEGKKWESAIENANSISELKKLNYDNEYDAFYDNPNHPVDDEDKIDADYEQVTKMYAEKMESLISKAKSDYAMEIVNSNLDLKALETLLNQVKANEKGLIGGNEDLPKNVRIEILSSMIETEKNLAKEREEKIASAGDYSKVKVENTTSFENKKAIASAVVDSEGKTITIPANKNLANEIKQMKEVAEIGKVRSDNRLNYIGVRDGYLVATNGRTLRRIKVDGLPEDLQGAYDIESEGNNLVLKKKNYDMNIPNYQKVFPSKNDSHFELDNKETINAIKDLKKINYFKETRDKLKITLNKNGVFIGSRKIGSGFDGEERNIVINPNLLIPGLTNGPSSTISFDDDSVTDGYIMRALGISTNVGDSLVMPIIGGEVPNPDEYAKEHNERNQNLKNSIMESFKTDLQHERMKDVSDGLKSKAMDFMSSLDTKNGYEAKNEIITALPLIHKLLTEDRFKDMGLKPEFGRVDDSKYVSFRDKNGDSFRVSQFDNPRIAKFIKQLAADGEFGNVRKSYFDDEYFEKSFIYDQPSMFSTYETVKNIIDALHENR